MGGLTLCELGDINSSVSYDIMAVPQGIIFCVYALFCILCELVFLYVTIRFFWNDPEAFKRTYFVLLYLTFHLSLLCYILYFFGGLICYGTILYNIISNLPYFFQGIGMYSIIMEMVTSLSYLSELDGNPKSICHFHFLPIIILYSIGFVLVFFWDISNDELDYFFLYNVIWYTVSLGCFYLSWRHLFKQMSLMYPSFISEAGISKWLTTVRTIMILMSIRVIVGVLNFTGFTYYLKDQYIGLFTLYVIAIITGLALAPCIVLTMFLLVRPDQTMAQKISGKFIGQRKRFTETTKNSLAELLDYENTEENLA